MLKETIVNFFHNDSSSLIPVTTSSHFPINIGIDSLSTTKLYRSELIKNITRGIHALTKDVKRKYPYHSINFHMSLLNKTVQI